MPLPAVLLPLLKTRQFWTNFWWLTEPAWIAGEEPEQCTVEIPVANGFGLSLSFDLHCSGFTLYLKTPHHEPHEIAWDDQAHWHPHVLRWSELESICRAAALVDAEFVHPGPLLLLLYRFAPICEGDDVPRICAMLESAWRSQGSLTSAEIQQRIERVDCREATFRWRYSEPVAGWVLEQADEKAARGLYTLRGEASVGFPFADWQRLLDEAERVIAGRPQEYPASTIRLRETHALSLSIPCGGALPPSPAARLIQNCGDRVLGDLQIGTMASEGSTGSIGGDQQDPWSEVSLSVMVKGELQRGIAVMRDLLWWSRAPAAVRLRRKWSAVLPLDLNQPPVAPAPLCLEIAALRTEHWGKTKSHYRIDHVPFPASTREALKTVLTAQRASGPDEDGWYEVAFSGGSLRICLAYLDEDEDLDGATVVIERMNRPAAELLFRLLTEAKLLLLPLAVATSAEVTVPLQGKWPPVRIVTTAEELFEILSAGPFAWWQRGLQK